MRTLTFRPYLAIVLTLAWSIACAQAQFTFTHVGGGPTGTYTANPEPGSFTIAGGGNDIWDALDEFSFAYVDITGDFDISVKLEAIEAANRWTKAGIMARETLNPDSRMAFSKASPAGPTAGNTVCNEDPNGAADVSLMYRTWIPNAGPNGGQHEDRLVPDPGYPGSPWVRLQREGNIIRGYASADGVTWGAPVVQNSATWVTPIGGAPTPLAATLKVGLGVSRHGCSVTQTATVQFRNLQAAQISAQPQNQTAEQGFPATFRIGLAGLASWEVQWLENGVEIPGATGRSYTTPDTQVSDSGKRYSARARDTLSGLVVTSAEAVLSVIPDTTAPSLVSAAAPAGDPVPVSFDVVFSEPVQAASAQNVANYAVSGLTLNSATLQADGTTVRIASSPLRGAGCLVLTVNGVSDRAGNVIAPNSTTVVYWDTGSLYYERYNGIAGGAVSQLTGNAKFPDSPDLTDYVPQFETPGGGGDHGENWGARFRGYLTPPESGNYVFAVSSDDQSELWLSTDENPANKVLIAREPEWAGYRAYINHGQEDRGGVIVVNANRGTPPMNISVPKALQRGCRYYVEYLFAEGCCGDYGSVTWQTPSEGPIANGDEPIQGQYLSPFRTAPSFNATTPADLTVYANQSASFTVAASGTPAPAIQWYRNGAAIPGATSATYTIPLAAESDSGSTFYAVATSAMGSAQSRTATLTVLVDNQAPTIVSADAPLGVATQFDLVFSEPVNEADAENLGAYSISGGVTLNSAELQADNRTVRFTCSSLYTTGCKILTVPAIRDRAIPPNMMPSGVIGVVAAVGTIRYHQFNGVDTVNIPVLLADPDFPNNPDVIAYKTSIEGPDNDGGNNFQDYGGQFLGWIHPPVDGQYRFYLAADDHAELYLSTDEDPANKVLIASEPVWANFREWTGPAAGQGGRPCSSAVGTPDTTCMNVSQLISLQRGCKYYIEMIFKEDGGGDYGSVTWQLPGGTVPVNGSAPTIVARHLSPFDIPPRILSEPVDITEQEGRIVTFTANIIAPQLTLQWYRDGVAIPGATALSYTIGPLRYPEDNGARFSLVATNPLGQATTRAALLTVIEDTTPPDLVSAAGSTTLDRVTASYSEAMDPGTAGDAFNYSITGGTGPAVVSATLSADGKTVVLFLDPGTPLELNTDYTVMVNNVNDYSGNQLVTDSASFHSVVEGCGGLIFEAYNTGGGNAVNDLRNYSGFPNSPDFTAVIFGFDSTLAGGIYANNGREGYGARVRGLYVPPFSGDWVFYLRSDDAGELWLNPNGPSPAGKVLIAEQPACCNTLGDEAISSRAHTLNLVGGQPYYIEALYKEGTGGDYVQVGARVRGSADPVVPIGARDLGQYAVPGLTGTLTVQGPADQAVDDNRTATFSVTATSSMGLPICYQWYRDGVAIAGATGPSYSFLATLADNGAVFTVRASIVGNSVDSAGATLTVRIDDKGPLVVSAKGVDTFRNAYVKFNELMDAGSAGDPFNYTISGLTVDEAELLADGVTVRLTTSLQTPGTVYEVLVQGALDAAGNVVNPDFDTAQFTAFTLSCGLLVYEGYYDIGSGVAVADLVASPKFPWSPDETRLMNMFDTIAILGTSDYRNNSGGRVHGVFIPPTSGNWIFYLRSDDASELFLNPTGIDPAGKVSIVSEPACCGPFSAHASAPQALTAGQPYYIEGIYKEGGGGDYIQVAAKLDTDPTAPDNLRGIGSSSIGIYADPTGAAPITITQHPTSQTVCLDPLSTTQPSVSFTVAASAVPEGTLLSSQDFNSGNGGYTVQTDTAFSGSWAYNATAGAWQANGQDAELGAPMTSRLTSPPITVNQAGVLRLRFSHRWNFEPGWDGGAVQVSINGGPYTTLPSGAFSENGYSGIVLGNSASILAGQSAFINNSAGHDTGALITSAATLGTVSAGATVSIRFLYAADTNTRGAVPNWEISSVSLNEGGAEGVPPLVQWQRNNGAGWADVAGALSRTYSFVPRLADNGAQFRALIASAGSACTPTDAATLTVIQKNTPPRFDLGPSTSSNEDGGAQSVAGFASNIQPHSIPRNTTLTFDTQPINSDLYGVARIAGGILHLTDAGQGSASGALGLNLPATQVFSTFEVSWKSYIGDGAGGGADGYSLSIGDNMAGDPGPTGIGEEGRGDDLIITVDTFNNADIRPVADEGIAIMWGGPYNAGGTELAFQNIPKDNPGNGNYLRKSTFVNAKVTVNATGLATLTYDGNTISGQIPNYTGLSVNRVLFWGRTGGANDNQWVDDVSGSEWINNFLVDTASVEDGQSVSFEVSNDNPALFTAQPAISANGTLTYTAAANACGSATVTVVARDNAGTACNGDDASDPKTFTITVGCVNDCPAATAQAVSAVTGVPTAITLTGADPDGDGLTAAVASNPTHGSLSVVAGVLTYTSTAGYVGPDSFTFTVSDGTCTSGPATVSITVTASANLPPTCVAGVAPADCGVTLPNSGIIYTIAVDGSSACLALSSAGTTDPDGDSLAISWVIDGTNTLAGAVVTSCLSVGCHTIVMTASDGKGGQCQTTLRVCVVTPSEACEQLIALVESTTVERKNKRPLIVSLKAAKAAFESDSLDVGAQMLQVFRHKVAAQIARTNPDEAATFDQAAAAVIAALECSSNLPPRNDE